MRIQSNQGLFTQNRYNHTTTELNKTLNKLSSGYQINKAGDDAAGLSISEKMRSQIRGLNQAGENIEDAKNFVNVIDGALGTIQSPMLQRIRELIIQAANDTNAESDRQIIQKEIDEIIEGIDDVVYNTEFNTIKPLIAPTEIVPGSSGGAGKADIVFIVDNTGSMGEAIQNLKNNIENFVSALKAHNIDVNLGLVYYGDQSALPPQTNMGGDGVSATSLGFPLDVDAFKTKVHEMPMSGGADWSESGLEGIILANAMPGYRSDATKNYILITDATVHESFMTYEDLNSNGIQDADEDDVVDTTYSNFTVDDVINTLADTIVTVIGSLPNTGSGMDKYYAETHAQLIQISAATGGDYLDVFGSYSEQLLGLAEKITNESGGSFTEEALKPVIIQSGANQGQHIEIPLYDHRDFRLMLKGIALSPYDSAMEGLQRVDSLIEKISNRRAEYGAISNRLEHAYNNVKNTEENLTNAEANLRDADMAKEMTKLHKDQVLLQSTQSMMAQINQMSQGILQLLK